MHFGQQAWERKNKKAGGLEHAEESSTLGRWSRGYFSFVQQNLMPGAGDGRAKQNCNPACIGRFSPEWDPFPRPHRAGNEYGQRQGQQKV
jgi:hypothetical protein